LFVVLRFDFYLMLKYHQRKPIKTFAKNVLLESNGISTSNTIVSNDEVLLRRSNSNWRLPLLSSLVLLEEKSTTNETENTQNSSQISVEEKKSDVTETDDQSDQSEIDILLGKINEKIKAFSLMQSNHFESIRQEIDARRAVIINDFYVKNQSEPDESHLLSLLANLERKSREIMGQVDRVEQKFRLNFDTNIKPRLTKVYSNCQNSEVLEKRLEIFEIFANDLKRNKFELPNNEDVNVLDVSNGGLVFGRLHLHEDFLTID
jgi:hypothetical protein